MLHRAQALAPASARMLAACVRRRAAAGAARFARTWSGSSPAMAYAPAALAGRAGLCAVGLCCTWSPGLVLARSARSTHRWEADASASDVLRQMLISKGAPQVEELSWDGGKLIWLWRRLWKYVDGSWVRQTILRLEGAMRSAATSLAPQASPFSSATAATSSAAGSITAVDDGDCDACVHSSGVAQRPYRGRAT